MSDPTTNLSNVLPQVQPELNTIQSYYLAFSARRKLSGEACRENLRLRRLVAHANLLDNLVTQHEGEKVVEASDKPTPQLPLPEQDLCLTHTAEPDLLAAKDNESALFDDSEIDVLLAKGLDISPLIIATAEYKMEDPVTINTSPTTVTPETDQEILSQENADLVLCRTVSRCLLPGLGLDLPIQDPMAQTTSEAIPSASLETALVHPTEPPPLVIPPTF